jgi:hypothetical protein
MNPYVILNQDIKIKLLSYKELHETLSEFLPAESLGDNFVPKKPKP